MLEKLQWIGGSPEVHNQLITVSGLIKYNYFKTQHVLGKTQPTAVASPT